MRKRLAKMPVMPRGRQPSKFELLKELAGFKVTEEQLTWLRDASESAGEVSLSQWLRKLAVEAGQKQLKTPFPRRKVVEAPKPKKR